MYEYETTGTAAGLVRVWHSYVRAYDVNVEHHGRT